MAADELEGMPLSTVNDWLARHRGHNHTLVMTRSKSEALHGTDAAGDPLPIAAGMLASVILTELKCLECGSGITLRNDEPDTGDPQQLRRLFGP